MKSIEFTQNELSSVFGVIAMSQTISTAIRDKFRFALKAPENCTVSITDTEISYTPAQAYKKVLDRKERAKFENEAKKSERRIKELEEKANRLAESNAKMYAALNNLENDDNKIPDHAWLLVQEAIENEIF